MPDDLLIPQLLVVRDRPGPRVAGRSADLPAGLDDAAVAAAADFGPRPPGVACPAALFALPAGPDYVAVTQVADLGPGGDPPLGFRTLFVPARLYAALGSPFAVADRFPPDWAARGELPTLSWPAEPSPGRPAEAVRAVLRDGDAPLLLGGTQALLDGGRVLLVADRPADAVVLGLWELLPDRTRAELWPATFRFVPDPRFHVAAVPVGPDPWPAGALSADQCRDYPEGRYEVAVQIAAEAGDQADLDRLFARRTGREVLRAAAVLCGAAGVAAVAVRTLS